MKIKIINKTEYDTRLLQRILRIAAKRVGVRKDKTIIVTHSTIGAPLVHGWGRYGSRKFESRTRVSQLWELSKMGRGRLPNICLEKAWDVQLTLPLPKDRPSRRELTLSLAAVGAHEFMHNLGVRHPDMTGEQRYCLQSWPLRWDELEGIELRTKTEVKEQRASQIAAGGES
jgi:hypothetical protein